MKVMDSDLSLGDVLDQYSPQSEEEAADVARLRELAARGDAWDRSTLLHATASALVVHPPTGRVLLRWHQRMNGWLQVGGHADPGESSPLAVAHREAAEETSLSDLLPWPDPARPEVIQVVIVPVPAGRGEPAHHHADIRYLFATAQPDAAVSESEAAQIRWLRLDKALFQAAESNLEVLFTRTRTLLTTIGASSRSAADPASGGRLGAANETGRHHGQTDQQPTPNAGIHGLNGRLP
jgi:8-oxo-dGTP pyrophosphatase MutT (NUDIX family)